MKKLFCLQMLLFLSFSPIAVKSQTNTKTDSSTSKNWAGRYTYTYTEPATQGGSVPVIEYVLIVSQKGDSLIARLTEDGYQSLGYDYRYTAKATGDHLNLYFSKVLNLEGEPMPDKRLIEGKLSGTLVRTTIRGRTKYVFKSETLFGSKFSPFFKKKS